jgi:putative ABC transport system permease protein
VIVNQSFVRLVFGDRNPLGRRLRYVHREEWDGPREDEKASPWYEIVGVVRDMGMADARDPKIAGIYHPATPDRIYPAQVAVHVKGEPEAFIPRLRALATETDPTLRLYEVTSLDALSDTELAFIAFWFRMLLGVSAIALTLSLAGIYAVMAFTVARRTREIGIRVALGADARRVVTAVFRRPLTQVGIGIGVGVLLLMLMASGDIAKLPTPKYMVGIVAYALFMMGVCMLACIVPTRRALRIEPTEALKGDG